MTSTDPAATFRPDVSVAPRRAFLRVLGGGIIVSALPVFAGCRDDMPAAAVSAWRAAPPADTEPRRWALSHALLAPNPHNLQPWIVDLRTPGQIVLFYDTARSLPATDPLYRQLIIGCGAFLELLLQALAARGQAAQISVFPEGEFAASPDARPVAVVRLTNGAAAPDPLFNEIRRRRTHRMPYDTAREITAATVESLQKAAPGLPVAIQGSVDDARRSALRDIATRAWEIEVRTPRTFLESVHLFRVGDEEILRHRDGISLTGLMPRLAKAMGWMAPEKIVEPGSSGFKRSLEMGQNQARSAMGWLWLTTAGNTRALQIDAGRAYVRLHLQATTLGVALQPMSQVLQEYAEMAQVQGDLYKTLGVDPAMVTIQMLARVGYAQGAQPSPRRELDTLLRT